jgi:hypothetical protein
MFNNIYINVILMLFKLLYTHKRITTANIKSGDNNNNNRIILM